MKTPLKTDGSATLQPNEPLSPRLTPRQVAQVDEILDQLLDLPPDERLPTFRKMRIEDSAVAAELDSLLKAARASGSFLSTPPRARMEEAPPDGVIGMRMGAWRITRSIGHGGMGDVYEGIRADGDFEQRVAIKLLQREAAAQLERFQSERQILARLEHSGIARLYDGGVTDDGRPFMVMEYVEGVPITEYCARTHANFEQRLKLFIQVCDAVAFAHRNLIVHRDLKPSNILVTSGGTVKLLDFGIAKLIDGHMARTTQLTAMPMTPICAAPEQLTGAPITTATDVYALGLLLFDLLTGTHPWMGSDTPVLQAMRTVLQRPAPTASMAAEANADAPVPVRLIRGDLDAIIAKSLRKEPVHRYATVAALELDIAKAMSGEPVEARAGARLYVVGRVLRRYRWAAAAASAVFISLAAGLGAAAWQAEKVSIERDSARRDAAREEAVRYSLTSLFHSAISDQGTQATTAKGMIDGSAKRVLREYQDQPQLAGQLVLTLADLYGALEDVNGAAALLQGYVDDANPHADPVSRADARQKLANIELLRGHTDRAAQLLDQAEAFWAKSPTLYLEERLEELTVRARLQRTRGDLDGAIATQREAIAQRVALSGHDHRETAVLYNSLAISLAVGNHLDEALQAYHETIAIYRALSLADGIDAQIIVANMGTLELRSGHLQEAETLLKSAVERERSLAGDSAATAAGLGYYGRLLAVTNRLTPAIAVLNEATNIAVKYAGESSPVALQNRLFLGEAQLSNGDRPAAVATITTVRDASLKSFGPAHPLTLRSQLAMTLLSMAARDYAAAQVQLADVVVGLRKLGPQSESNLAQALETLGDVELHQGQTPQAIVTLHDAIAIREKTPGDIWELAAAQERLGEALAKSGNDGASAVLKKAASDLESQLGANHPQAIRAKAALTSLLD
jgi:tetratricopeptide (TPR) repeat protein